MSARKNDGGQAFPFEPSGYEPQWGMTLRDKFADSAMKGMLSDLPKTLYGLHWKADLAKTAYEVADAMLIARDAA